MNHLKIILIVFLSQIVSAQTKSTVFEAIRKTDMTVLGELFDRKIEYCFDNQIEILEKSAALKAVKAFLDRNVPKSMTPMHKGSSKAEDSNFAIAILETTTGKKFRIYVYAENSGGKLLVQELRIDKQE
ncbi:MAG: DUF4783 domain-containing protein [Saprospiraceae bacterium]|nr:DUF4783 domain-containing protein [Saprospiraceae bacterium]MBK8450614.1 DUF4783 domain-containing protein [Saprospiraceae bacterium]MBK8485305.1 DUF4783 domain-containing protein [Saprospiraceae bacterium]MBK9222522.1 DUF4783 domain-containing protein [Saprospiraceae bacterium]MBK9727416.1 DUF4783 domain-containing protein [Saprospiraceae bacterium]